MRGATGSLRSASPTPSATPGLTVWWDRHIKGGSEFSRDIETQLDAAARVLVLWSKEAVNSRWVRDEASVAADSGRLVSATIDGTPPPLGFRQFQTIDLKGWSAKGAAIPPALAEALEVDAPTPATSRPARPPARKWMIGGAGALLLGVAAVAIIRPAPFDRILSGEQQDDGLSLAIMPFATEGGPGIAYLGAGLSSALADSLAPLSGLKITASTSTQALAGQKLTAPEIGKRLGITHLVEGNVQQSGDRFNISVRLVEAKTSQQIWARSFEGDGRRVAAAEDADGARAGGRAQRPARRRRRRRSPSAAKSIPRPTRPIFARSSEYRSATTGRRGSKRSSSSGLPPRSSPTLPTPMPAMLI